uniref:transposase n=1 Tax=Hymenobacter siberiensis TaxID=2848396 RepID=UPI001C1E225C|nr:transposase [Hymenobacter siberiensis]
MFDQVAAEGKLLARTILFDSWYAGSTNLKRIHRAGWTFFTTLKSNRLVSLAKESGYQGLTTLEPPPGGWSQGVEVRLKEVPFGVKRFKLVATNGDIEWVQPKLSLPPFGNGAGFTLLSAQAPTVAHSALRAGLTMRQFGLHPIEWFITNHLAAHLTREMVIEAVQVRWQVEEFHRSFKQLTGVGEVPVPEGDGATQPLGLLLLGLGIAASTRPPHGANYLSGVPTAMGTLPAGFAPKTTHSSTCIVECVSSIKGFSQQQLVAASS